MFFLPLILLATLLVVLVLLPEEELFMRVCCAIFVVLMSFNVWKRIPIAPGYPTDVQIRKQIDECEKDLPRNLRCHIEVVKP